MAARVTGWCRPDGETALLTVFRTTKQHDQKQHDQRQIDRAVRAQKICADEHGRPAVESYERRV